MIGDVTWTTPGRSSADSLPLGNGDLAANIWTEPNGDIALYLAKNDAWDHLGRLVKIGRLRLTFDPPLKSGESFSQSLSLADASVIVTDGILKIRVWIDAHWPRLLLEIEGPAGRQAHVRLDPWRDVSREITGGETHGHAGFSGGPLSLLTAIDRLAPDDSAVAWYRRNETSVWGFTLEQQGLAAFKSKSADPLLHLTSGGMIFAPDAIKIDERTLKLTLGEKRGICSVLALTAQTSSADHWLAQARELRTRLTELAPDECWKDHTQSWREFWSRSQIVIESRGPDWGNAKLISEHAAWQRYLVACCSRGLYPVKFNGGLFTADWGVANEAYDADYRRWGGGYWWQNTRLPYWAALAAGDFDLLRPVFRMYRDMLPLAEERTRLWFSHEGAFFAETVGFWGAFLPSHYGWNRTGKKSKDVENQYVGRLYLCGIELIFLMLETHAHTGDEALLTQDLLPIARSALTFFARHYGDDASGKLHIAPAQTLETWWESENPSPEIAGLHAVLPRLLALPASFLTVADRSAWTALLARLPALPASEEGGKRRLLPAAKHEAVPRNSENAELYAVFPFRLYGIGLPDLETGRWTFARRLVHDTGGWRQDAVQAALLGLPEAATSYLAKNLTDGNQTPARFKGFCGPNFDWVPDFDHSSVSQLALQAMLVQAVERKIYLFPAWPVKRWNVAFKLHLPGQTTIAAELKDGRLVRLEVTPDSRRDDVVVLLDQT